MKLKLKDSSEHPDRRELDVEIKELGDGSIGLKIPGYGDMASADGEGIPVVLEIWHGQLRLVAFPDINTDCEPEIIDLEGAREDQRQVEMLLASYQCPGCGHEWQEDCDCVCDSECPECGLKSITAKSWTKA